MLQACLNGRRTRTEHPGVPVTPSELGAAAAEAVAAGATDLHLHPRDARGTETLDPTVVADVLTAVRRSAPGMSVGITTGPWTGTPAQDVEAVRGWTVLPDHVSVTWQEDGATDLVTALLERGIQVAAGLRSESDVRDWMVSPHRALCSRVLLKLPDGPAPGEVRELAETVLAHLDGTVPIGRILLHGEGSTAWEALEYAGWAGLLARIGLEDTLVLPDGSPAPDNGALVRAARGLLWQGYP